MNHNGIPLVSVIMPLYNKRRHVADAVESVRRQTFQAWELIIVDDGSTDGSALKVPKDDPRIVFLSQRNRGPSAARNIGMVMARGSLVTFLDADDRYYPEKIGIEVSSLMGRTSAEWMISAFDYQAGDVLHTRRINNRDGGRRSSESFICQNALEELSVSGWHINGLCARKDLLVRTGGFDERMRYNEITDLMVRCALAEPTVMVCQRPLCRVVEVADSASKDKAHVMEGIRRMGESLFRLSGQHPEAADLLAARAVTSLHSYVAMLIISGRTAEAREYLRRGYPAGRDRGWWKLRVGSMLPSGLARRLAARSGEMAVMR